MKRKALVSLGMLDFQIKWVLQMHWFLVPPSEWNHLDRIVIEHHDNVSSVCTDETWIRRLFFCSRDVSNIAFGLHQETIFSGVSVEVGVEIRCEHKYQISWLFRLNFVIRCRLSKHRSLFEPSRLLLRCLSWCYIIFLNKWCSGNSQYVDNLFVYWDLKHFFQIVLKNTQYLERVSVSNDQIIV